MRVGALPRYPSNSLRYNLTWSTEGLINEYCNPCEAIVDGQLAFLPGGVEEYLEIRERAGSAPGGRKQAAAADVNPPTTRSVPSSAARQRAGQKELTRLERQIARLTDAEARLSEALAESASDYVRLIELGAELRAVQEERAELEERWLVVAEESGG